MLLTVGNDGHVTDVRRVVHETTDLECVSMLCCSSGSNIVAWCGACVRVNVPPRWWSWRHI